MAKKYSKIYRFRVSLREIEPEIWRVIEVPETYTFWDLHVAIQDAMGWLDCHLHEFVPGAPSKPSAFRIGIPEGPEDREYVAGWTVPIKQFFAAPGSSARYDYDFGDGWSHEVRLEAIEPRQKGTGYPRCTAGERACPPEDCGGPAGYQRLLEALADPRDEEQEDLIDWLKGCSNDYYPYDPEAFDPTAVEFWDPKERWEMMMEDQG